MNFKNKMIHEDFSNKYKLKNYVGERKQKLIFNFTENLTL